MVVAAGVAACGNSGSPAPKTPPPKVVASGSGSAAPAVVAPTFTATVLSATIESDCAPAGADPAGKASPPLKAEASKRKADAAWVGCIQSEVVLGLALDGPQAGAVRLAAVEVTSGSSTVTLTPRAPTRWDPATATYVPWDGTVTPGVPLQVRYALSAPPDPHASSALSVAAEVVLLDGTVVTSPVARLDAIVREAPVKT